MFGCLKSIVDYLKRCAFGRHNCDARHTRASLKLKQGIHPKIVQERLGHSSIQITLDTYSHVAPGLQQAAANRFDDIVLFKNQDGSQNEMKEISG
jgi:integrase